MIRKVAHHETVSLGFTAEGIVLVVSHLSHTQIDSPLDKVLREALLRTPLRFRFCPKYHIAFLKIFQPVAEINPNE